MASKMDDRKRRILKIITDDYIASAEPVGSRTVAKRYDLGLSAATIRNEMADLEERGYLEQPYTSSGRVPSELGYRYYVDALISMRNLTEKDVSYIIKELDNHSQGIEAVIHQTSKLLTQLTKYPAIIMAPEVQSSLLKHIQIIKLSETTGLMVLVTNSGHVENKIIELKGNLSEEELEKISNLLNHHLRGVSLKALPNSPLIDLINGELLFYDRFFGEALKVLIRSLFESHSGERVYVDGTAKILEQPEFADLARFKPLLCLFEEEEKLYRLLAGHQCAKAQVKIGHENQDFDIRDCSVVTASYEIAGKTVGVIGVLGPTRMEYARVMPIVEYTATILSNLLTRLNKK